MFRGIHFPVLHLKEITGGIWCSSQSHIKIIINVTLHLKNMCTHKSWQAMSYDRCVINDFSSVVFLWSANCFDTITRQMQSDSNELCFPVMTYCTYYDNDQQRRFQDIVVPAKHLASSVKQRCVCLLHNTKNDWSEHTDKTQSRHGQKCFMRTRKEKSIYWFQQSILKARLPKKKDLSVTRVMLKRFSVVKNFKIESSNSKQWDKQTEHLAGIRRSTCSTCTS